MTMHRSALLAPLLWLAATQASAQEPLDLTIGKLASACDADPESAPATRISCIAYLRGFVEGFGSALEDGNPYFCMPSNVTGGQVALIFSKWAGLNPEVHHQPAHRGVIVAIKKAFPCPDPTEQK